MYLDYIYRKLEEKSKKKEDMNMHSWKFYLLLFYIFACMFLPPVMVLYSFIWNIDIENWNFSLIKLLVISLSGVFILFILIIKIIFKKKSNFYKPIFKLLNLLINHKNKLIYIITIIFIFIYFRAYLMRYLFLGSLECGQTLSLVPCSYIIYVYFFPLFFNLLFKIYSDNISGKKTNINIDYNIFSENIFKYISLTKVFLVLFAKIIYIFFNKF